MGDVLIGGGNNGKITVSAEDPLTNPTNSDRLAIIASQGDKFILNGGYSAQGVEIIPLSGEGEEFLHIPDIEKRIGKDGERGTGPCDIFASVTFNGSPFEQQTDVYVKM